MMEQFIRLAEIYGGDINHWPEETRQEAFKFSLTHPDCELILQQALILDQSLEKFTVPDEGLARLKSRIRNELKPRAYVVKSSFIDQLLGWLMPASTRLYWRPAIVACLPLLLGISIGMNLTFDQEVTQEEELSLMALTIQPMEDPSDQ